MTGTDLQGFVDGYGADLTVWFELGDDSTFVDGYATAPEALGPTGPTDFYYLLFDYPPDYTIYYRVYAQNAAGITVGNILTMTTPDLTLENPPYTLLCNQVSVCSNPTSVDVVARVVVPLGAPSPYANVAFEEGFSPRNFLGYGTSSYVDDPGSGTRTYTYKYTFTPLAYNPNVYYVSVVGDTGANGGTVLVGYIAFTVDTF